MDVRDAVAELRELRIREPFTPFVIVLNDGRRLPVDERWQFAIQLWVGSVFDERHRLVRFKPAEIVAIEVAL